VFNASLTGLHSHPARYGWNWDVVIQTQGGYGAFNPGAMNRLIGDQPAVSGWSELAFGQLPIDDRIVPVLGIWRHLGSVQPPTTSGHPLSGSGQIELGTVTLRQLGKKIGDTVRIGIPPSVRTVTVVGTVMLPSFGVGGADHVSLGRGAMLPEATLLAALGRGSGTPRGAQSIPVFPSAVAIDLAPGTTHAQRTQLVHRIVSAKPDGVTGGSYELHHALASAVVNTTQLGGQPLALSLGLAAAAVLSLALAVLSQVRRRRQELALLKALGMTRGQVGAVIAWQATLTLLVAVGSACRCLVGPLQRRALAGCPGPAGWGPGTSSRMAACQVSMTVFSAPPLFVRKPAATQKPGGEGVIAQTSALLHTAHTRPAFRLLEDGIS
jgi:hypothetical protein